MRIGAAIKGVLAPRMTPMQRLWFSRLRHGELAWQHRLGARARALRFRGRVPQGTLLHGTWSSPRTAQVVAHVDTWALRSQTCLRLQGVLAAAGIEYVVLPDTRGTVRRIAVPAESMAAVERALTTLPRTEAWWVDVVGPHPRVVEPALLGSSGPGVKHLRLHRHGRLDPPQAVWPGAHQIPLRTVAQ